jgi:hypothetical protein
VLISAQVLIECRKYDGYQEICLSLGSAWQSSEEHASSHHRMSFLSWTCQILIILLGSILPHLSSWKSERRTLVERFAHNIYIIIVVDALDAMVAGTQTWFDADARINSGFETNFNAQANKLRHAGRVFYHERYKPLRQLVQQCWEWFGAVTQKVRAPLLELRYNLTDMFMTRMTFNSGMIERRSPKTCVSRIDREGNVKFNPDLWNDILFFSTDQVRIHPFYFQSTALTLIVDRRVPHSLRQVLQTRVFRLREFHVGEWSTSSSSRRKSARISRRTLSFKAIPGIN